MTKRLGLNREDREHGTVVNGARVCTQWRNAEMRTERRTVSSISRRLWGWGWSTFSRPLHVVYQKWVSFKLQELKKARPCRVQGEREINVVIAEDNWQWMPRLHGARNTVPAAFPREGGEQVDRVQGLLPWHANHSLFLNSEAGSQQTVVGEHARGNHGDELILWGARGRVSSVSRLAEWGTVTRPSNACCQNRDSDEGAKGGIICEDCGLLTCPEAGPPESAPIWLLQWRLYRRWCHLCANC